MNPAMPAATNAERQPNAAARKGIVAGAMIAPTLAPELKMLVENARSRFGNHCAVALIAAGKLPASPKPRHIRAARKPLTLWTSPCPAAAMLQRQIDSA